jgi:hypothetical protein
MTRTVAYGIKTTLFAGDNDISHCPTILPALRGNLYTSIPVKHFQKTICGVSGIPSLRDAIEDKTLERTDEDP